jgi:tetratricopeptide (TPR) repeat protein
MPTTEAKLKTIAKPHSRNALFTEDYLRRALGISRSQLRAWERAGWISPVPGSERKSARGKSGHEYTGTDLLTLKTLLRLRKGGVPTARLRTVHDALRRRFDALGIRQPFSDLHLTGEYKRVLVTFRGARMEPLTGQLLLDYAEPKSNKPLMMPRSTRSSAARGGSGRAATDAMENQRRAERFFNAALRQESIPGGLPKAIRAYRRAIELNPKALGALLNLGTLYYNQRLLAEAEQCYRAALEINPRSALAHFNMGNLADESGEPLRAIEHYEKAITLDTNYPDPRYNLALVYEKLGRHGQAWKNWKAYLKLDPDSKWAALARNRLAQQPWTVVPSRPQDHSGR